MREAFVGFDSAWAGRSPGGIAWATFTNRRLARFAEPQLAGFDDAARIIETLQSDHDYVLVAIDQPTVVPNQTGQRPVDGVARALIGKLRSGVQPANRSKETMFGPTAPIWRFLNRLGASQDAPGARAATDGLYLLEVFPALALPALQPEILTRGKAAFYNPARKKTFAPGDWRLVADTVRDRAGKRGLAPLSEWAGRQTDLTAPSKHDQDRLDSAICLLVALEWRYAPRDRVAVIGDARTGYMVTSVSPETREILGRAAIEHGVPFGSTWQEIHAAPKYSTGGSRKPVQRLRAVPAASESTHPTAASPGRIRFDDSLLRHSLVRVARAGGTITYGDVAREFGFNWSQGAQSALIGSLRRIGNENRLRGEPQLMALVVNKAQGRPGPGYFQTVGLGASPASEQSAQHVTALIRVWAFEWPD